MANKYAKQIRALQKRADELTDENYHSEAVILSNVAELLEKLDGKPDDVILKKVIAQIQNVDT